MSQLPVLTLTPSNGGINIYSTVCIASVTGLVAAFLFSAFPEIDLAASNLFYAGDGRFLFSAPSAGSVIRFLLRILFWLVCIAAVAGFLSLAFFNRKLLGLGLTAWAYITLCVAMGPGVVANLGFKDHWGRARPVHITEFGGAKKFTPPMLRADQCEKNCSFISGEASNFYALGFAFAFLFGTGQQRRKFFIAAIAAGSFAGLIRIGGGGHFLSDVIFAGVFMAFVTKALAWLVLERWSQYLTENGAFHQRTLKTGQRMATLSRQAWKTVEQAARSRRKTPPKD